MKIIIHRGINQIGGCITEITTEKTKIIIDLGHNLPKSDKPANDPKANEEAIKELTKDVSAIFYTHYHGDHVDLFKFVPKNVKQYMGETAKHVMICKYKRLAKLPEKTNVTHEDIETLHRFHIFSAKQKNHVGDITVTPYFISHSACDAFMFVVEVNGKRILHTGDFRGHGYLSKELFDTIGKYILEKPVDVLITEGTMLARLDERVLHENDLKVKAEMLMEKKYVFIMCSSTDMERLASFHAAHLNTKHASPFVCDDYQKDILEIFSKSSGKKSELFDFFKKKDIYDFEETNQKLVNWMIDKGFCMLVRATEKFEKYWAFLKPHLNMHETILIHSMWKEYINPESPHAKKDYVEFITKFPVVDQLHTSGHAIADCLAKVCNLVNPNAAIIPIHSEHSEKFKELPISAELREKVVTTSCTVQGIEIEIMQK